MYDTAASSKSINPLADIFFPEFCLREIKNRINENKQKINEFDSNSVSEHLCNHSKSCKICLSSKVIPLSRLKSKLAIHRIVKNSGKYNFEHCKIPVNNKINVEYMRSMLNDYKDLQVCDFLSYGFPIGFKGDESIIPHFDQIWKYRNHKGATEYPTEINNYLHKECKTESILGPFKNNPFSGPLIVSPLNSVPKKDSSERRIILDLSFPKGNSINNYIDKDEYLGEKAEIYFPKVDDFANLIRVKGQGCLMFKKDLRKAYRQISIDPCDYNLVSFVWGKHIFCDSVLSMGLRSAAFICQRVTNAISFIMLKIGIAILNYLDDLAGAEQKEKAIFAYNCLGSVLEKCGFEESKDKACPPNEIMIFLGVLFNSITMTMEVTPDRLMEIKLLVKQWLTKDKATIKEIQSLLGKLNFVAACVRPSRIFVSRLLNWLRSIYNTKEPCHNIPEYVKKDLQWWNKFLPLYNGISLIEIEQWSSADNATFSSDSCLSGCGGFYHGNFFHTEFPEVILHRNFHITCLEILAIILCLKLWGTKFKGKRITVLCDNKSVTQIINSGKTREEFLQSALREICYVAALNEFEIRAEFIEGRSNQISDTLSRWHLFDSSEKRFNELTEGYELTEYLISDYMFCFNNNW